MTQGLASSIFLQDQDPQTRRTLKIWGITLLIALLLHLIAFYLIPSMNLALQAPRIEVQPISGDELEAVKKQWKELDKQVPKQILLSKDQSPVLKTEAPKDARYISDRNRIVEKEQQAQITNVIPKPLSQSPALPAKPQDMARPETEKAAEKTQTVDLSKLGIPLRLNEKTQIARNEPVPAQRGQTFNQEGGDQALQDKTLPFGSENILNTQESVYYSFYARIYETIGPLWQSLIRSTQPAYRLSEGEYSTTVNVILSADGSVMAVQHLRDSGVEEFDRAVDEAWKRSSRFPNPPKGLMNLRGEVHTGWTFTVSIKPGMGFQYMPPQRAY